MGPNCAVREPREHRIGQQHSRERAGNSVRPPIKQHRPQIKSWEFRQNKNFAASNATVIRYLCLLCQCRAEPMIARYLSEVKKWFVPDVSHNSSVDASVDHRLPLPGGCQSSDTATSTADQFWRIDYKIYLLFRSIVLCGLREFIADDYETAHTPITLWHCG